MKKMTPEKFKRLQALLSGKGDEVPEGFYTVTQLCKMFNITRTPMCNRVARLVKESPESIEKKHFYVHASDGRLHKVPHYKFKNL